LSSLKASEADSATAKGIEDLAEIEL